MYEGRSQQKAKEREAASSRRSQAVSDGTYKSPSERSSGVGKAISDFFSGKNPMKAPVSNSVKTKPAGPRAGARSSTGRPGSPAPVAPGKASGGSGSSRPSSSSAPTPKAPTSSAPTAPSAPSTGGGNKAAINREYDRLRNSGQTAAAEKYGKAQSQKLFGNQLKPKTPNPLMKRMSTLR